MQDEVQVEGLEHLPSADWMPDFQFGTPLGVGSYGTVFLVRDRGASKNFAVKVVDKRDTLQGQPGKVANLQREVHYLSQLDHPNVVRLHRVAQTHDSVVLLMDFAGMRNLYESQQVQEDKVFSPADARIVYEQVADAIHYCHARGIVHRDIKQENVVMHRDLRVVLVDFGAAHDADAPCDHVGTVYFMAPEVMAMLQADFNARKADIWSVGILVLEMLCGLNFLPGLLQWSEEPRADDPKLPRSLWSFLSSPSALTRAMQRRLSVSEALEGMMRGLLSPRVVDRWTAAQAVGSAWLQER